MVRLKPRSSFSERPDRHWRHITAAQNSRLAQRALFSWQFSHNSISALFERTRLLIERNENQVLRANFAKMMTRIARLICYFLSRSFLRITVTCFHRAVTTRTLTDNNDVYHKMGQEPQRWRLYNVKLVEKLKVLRWPKSVMHYHMQCCTAG